MTAMSCIFLFRAKEKANGAFDIEHTKIKRDGLGRFPDVSLFNARQQPLSNKQLLRKNIDPIEEKIE